MLTNILYEEIFTEFFYGRRQLFTIHDLFRLDSFLVTALQ